MALLQHFYCVLGFAIVLEFHNHWFIIYRRVTSRYFSAILIVYYKVCFFETCSSSLSDIMSLFSSVWLSRTSCFRFAVAISAACFFRHFVLLFWNQTWNKETVCQSLKLMQDSVLYDTMTIRMIDRSFVILITVTRMFHMPGNHSLPIKEFWESELNSNWSSVSIKQSKWLWNMTRFQYGRVFLYWSLTY